MRRVSDALEISMAPFFSGKRHGKHVSFCWQFVCFVSFLYQEVYFEHILVGKRSVLKHSLLGKHMKLANYQLFVVGKTHGIHS